MDREEIHISCLCVSFSCVMGERWRKGELFGELHADDASSSSTTTTISSSYCTPAGLLLCLLLYSYSIFSSSLASPLVFFFFSAFLFALPREGTRPLKTQLHFVSLHSLLLSSLALPSFVVARLSEQTLQQTTRTRCGQQMI